MIYAAFQNSILSLSTNSDSRFLLASTFYNYSDVQMSIALLQLKLHTHRRLKFNTYYLQHYIVINTENFLKHLIYCNNRRNKPETTKTTFMSHNKILFMTFSLSDYSRLKKG